ncbi:flagellar brake protein [Herbaspirillum sp. RTI4]|uniref:flagellar brake protein n=1 Tax=Herbaspirillum sp. RTI4 TaxID=3048640 RepID=UPI002AB3CC74|nr:flagellar brake protein [Herbaspirillum sp. RTI4]MDY7578321.1 flagellar brake protein [Herbaspirillum sp. RTI4]MEA9981186.1 flagellar brake protein [Herbaspirillum sp. RTI4]
MLNDKTPDTSQYRVHSRKEIVGLLTSMMDRNQLLSLLIKGGSESVITSILELDEDENCIIVDSAPSADLNKSILESNRILFEVLYNNIRINFTADSATEYTYQGRPAFRIEIPESLVRLQRREYFRVNTPISKPLRCTFSIPQDDESVLLVHTQLNNISAGGIGITDDQKLLDTTLGKVFEHCQLELTDNTMVPVMLQIRDCKEVKLASGKTVNRMGCEFKNMSRAVEAAIQRFITKMEREQNAKASGML